MRDGESETGKERKPVEGCVIKETRGKWDPEAPEKSSEGWPELSAWRKEAAAFTHWLQPPLVLGCPREMNFCHIWPRLSCGPSRFLHRGRAVGQELERLLSGWH